jgi:hypothetical protein
VVKGNYGITTASLLRMGEEAMTSFVGLIIVSVIAAIIVGACFVQDSVGSLKFWRSR